MSKKLEVRLLGRFEVSRDGKPIAITSRPAQSLFAYLILHAGTAHRREKLAGMLWSDSLEETARSNLRHALWQIRKSLPASQKRSAEYLLADDLSITFNPSAGYWLDVAELDKLSDSASADELMAVLSDYQGDLLPGFYDEWVVLEREHLYSIFEHHMARLMSLLQAEKRWLDILEWAERWIKLGQRPEPAYRALMFAHAAKGDMSKVAATYERCVKSLKEFGIEPSDQTRALYERLKARKETFEAGSTVSLKEKRKEAPKTNLPVPLTSFIGREKEVEEIVKLLAKNRLVTLTGSGGVGKTRLAIQAANRFVPKFKDGVWWVDLVGIADPARVPQAVAQVVDVPSIPNQPLLNTLTEYFRTKQTLLILDNCEHLISACAQLADQLLSTCENLKILATSREGLDILGETIWPVPSLSLPETQETYAIKSLSKFESIRLFSERALAVQPKFELTDQNAKAVVQTCRRLSGMPLAIELAAARVKMMSVDEIAKRLDDRFALLTAGNRTALPRHQTLRATIDWSFDLLSKQERNLFRRLAVFVGGFTLNAAEAITAGDDILPPQVIELLGNLINKSLVRAEIHPEAVEIETRYGMLETIREYAREKLRQEGEEQMLRSRHLEFFLNMVEEVGPKLEGPEQKILLDRLETEIDNLRTAMDWAVENKEMITALRFAGAFPRFWFIRAHHNEGVERLKAILDHPDARQPTTARLRALNAYLFMLWPAGQLAEMQPRGEEALALGMQLGDRQNSAFALLWLGVESIARGDYSLARSYLEQSMDIWQELEEKTYAAWTFVFRGEVAMLQGDTTGAQEMYLQAVLLLREAQDYPFLAVPLRRLGQLAMSQGDPLKATTFIKESLQHNWAVHDFRGTGACLAAFATLSLAQ